MSVKSLLTKSRLGAARKCKRLHQFQYELGYRPVDDEDALFFGTLVHAALEAWWNAKKEGLEEDAWLGRALMALSEAKLEDEFLRARAQVMIVAYHLRWKDEPYEVLGVELAFRSNLVNPATGRASQTWDLGGKLDVLVRDLRDGQVRFMEHKTSGEDISAGSDYWKRLRMDTQVSVYFEGTRSLGFDPIACVYDVLGKPAQRPGNVPLLDDEGVKIVLNAMGERVRTKDGKKWRQTADTAEGFVLQTRPETPDEFRDRLTEVVSKEPDRYLVRGEVVRLEAEMAAALGDVWMAGQEIREAELADRWPRNPDACIRVGSGTCPFFAVCAGEASLDDPSRYTRNADVHPELSNPQSQEAAL